MFSRIFNTTKSFFISDPASLSKLVPSEQLHSELSDAVEEVMVTTRRQSHGLPNEELRDGSEIDTPRTVSRRRKNGNSESSTPMVQAAKRRKSGLGVANDNGSDGSRTSALVASRQGEIATQVDSPKNVGVENVGRKEDALALGGQRSLPEQGPAETRTEADDNTSDIKHEQRLVSQQVGTALLDTAQDNPHYTVNVEIANASSEVNMASENCLSTNSKATHFRFGSEEPDVEAQTMRQGQPNAEAPSATVTQASEETDDEDGAPEIVTASAGAKTARARTLEAAKAAKRQRVASKEKRRERDDLLKQQAQSSKKSMKRKAKEISDDSPEPDRLVDTTNATPKPPLNHANLKINVRNPLPALLPEEILAAELVARPPTPPLNLEPRMKPKPKKHTFVDAEPRPPKDIKRGPVNVRVLEVGRQIIAPKGSKESRNLKESWLAGRRGRNGSGVFARRKVGEGFVRK
ncbi:MAG: hypothetical protein M1830_006410 [Pleopsidium flavum]|nr:MAG: hypothetical protein M1830_006410 [Pleopsidium flavum]